MLSNKDLREDSFATRFGTNNPTVLQTPKLKCLVKT